MSEALFKSEFATNATMLGAMGITEADYVRSRLKDGDTPTVEAPADQFGTRDQSIKAVCRLARREDLAQSFCADPQITLESVVKFLVTSV